MAAARIDLSGRNMAQQNDFSRREPEDARLDVD